MSELMNLTRPSFDPESLAYGDYVITAAATELAREVTEFADSIDPTLAVEIKIDHLGVESPVTKYDRATEKRIGDAYEGTSVRIEGEEGVNAWPANKVPTLELDVDPIDGTHQFTLYMEALIEWMHTPEDERPPHPICPSMISAGARRLGSNTPEWGVLAAPFMSPDGVVRWNAGPETPAVRIEPDGSHHRLLQTRELFAPTRGGVILLASDSAERKFRDPLQNEGYRVIKLESAVAAALCVMDPTLFERLRPGELQGDPIAGVVLRTAKNWDVAGAVALANQLGHFVCATDGSPRTFEKGASSAIIAVRKTIGRTLVGAIRPHL